MRIRRESPVFPPAAVLRVGAHAAPRLAAPLGLFLTQALRRCARRAPSAFERLGQHRDSVFLIRPDDLPIAFVVAPHPVRGGVKVVRPDGDLRANAQIRGRLSCLLRLFDGSMDADAAFFSRDLVVEGDTAAVLALHNAIEASDLTLSDLAGVPPFVERLARRIIAAAPQPGLAR